MELFYSADIDGTFVRLDQEESGHCVKVLRHKAGDALTVIDGEGSLYRCTLVTADSKAAVARIDDVEHGFGSHPYHLVMAVCPTKNIDRFEWFVEKATEIGLDVVAPVIGDHSERKVVKTERLKRLVLSAAKQSLKGAVPQVCEAVSVKDFINSVPDDTLRLICYCFEGERQRVSVSDVLRTDRAQNIAILIGPEGDFSQEEVSLAMSKGWHPVHLGDSRLRTETAALVAVTAVYLERK